MRMDGMKVGIVDDRPGSTLTIEAGLIESSTFATCASMIASSGG